MNKKLSQYLCFHNFERVAENTLVPEVLLRCRKCGMFRIVNENGYLYSDSAHLPGEPGWKFNEVLVK